ELQVLSPGAGLTHPYGQLRVAWRYTRESPREVGRRQFVDDVNERTTCADRRQLARVADENDTLDLPKGLQHSPEDLLRQHRCLVDDRRLCAGVERLVRKVVAARGVVVATALPEKLGDREPSKVERSAACGLLHADSGLAGRGQKEYPTGRHLGLTA